MFPFPLPPRTSTRPPQINREELSKSGTNFTAREERQRYQGIRVLARAPSQNAALNIRAACRNSGHARARIIFRQGAPKNTQPVCRTRHSVSRIFLEVTGIAANSGLARILPPD